MDFPITLDSTLNLPLYRQLTNGLREAILGGRLKAGESLPSTRDLAQLLGVSRDTVVRSYEELLAQGYIESATGAGTFVSKNLPLGKNDLSADKSLADAGHMRISLSSYGKRLGSVDLADSSSGDLPDLNYGAAPSDTLPARKWREILMKHCKLQQPDDMDYVGETFGYRPLREAIASYLKRSKAVNCHADQIVVFSGSQHALDLIGRVLINPGDDVAVENPGYCGGRENLIAQGARVHPVDVDQDGLKVDELEKLPHKLKLVYVTPSHQDPTGFVMSMERRKQLLAWADRTGTVIIEDAFDSDYRYGSKPMPSLQGMADRNAVIYLYSFWKILFPIISIGCAVLPPALVDTVERAKILVERNFPMVEHYALTDFLNEGHLERHIRKTRSIYGKRRQALIYSLAQNFQRAVTYFNESSGLHMLVRFNLPFDESTILSAAYEAGLPMVSTAPFYVASPVDCEFLIPFSSIPEDAIEDKIAGFARLIHEKEC